MCGARWMSCAKQTRVEARWRALNTAVMVMMIYYSTHVQIWSWVSLWGKTRNGKYIFLLKNNKIYMRIILLYVHTDTLKLCWKNSIGYHRCLWRQWLNCLMSAKKTSNMTVEFEHQFLNYGDYRIAGQVMAQILGISVQKAF